MREWKWLQLLGMLAPYAILLLPAYSQNGCGK
jgi:hypothetical protein